MEEGWIKINRAINKHWIWENPMYLKAWLSLLLATNHEEKRVLIESEIIICKRGQSLISVSNLAKLFGKGWTIQRVRTFLKLLSNDSMIELEGLRKTTRVTICKYDTYQSSQQADNEQLTNRQQTTNKQLTTTKECKELKNEKNILLVKESKLNNNIIFDFRKKLIENGFESKLVDDWLKVRKTKKATNTETALNDFLSEISKRDSDKNEMLKICIVKNWSGFKYAWVDNLKIQENGNNNIAKTGYTSAGSTANATQQGTKRIQHVTEADFINRVKERQKTFGDFE